MTIYAPVWMSLNFESAEHAYWTRKNDPQEYQRKLNFYSLNGHEPKTKIKN